MTEKLEHIGFLVKDLDASIAFYEKLGFSEHFALKRSDGLPWITYIRCNEDGLFLELVVNYDKDGPHTHRHEVVLRVEDLEEAEKELTSGGICFQRIDQNTIELYDLDENRILLKSGF